MSGTITSPFLYIAAWILGIPASPLARYSPLLCGQCNITSGRGVSASRHVTRVPDKLFEADIEMAILKQRGSEKRHGHFY